MIDVKCQQFKLEERQEKGSEKKRKEEETHIYSILDNRNSTRAQIIVRIPCTDHCENFNATLKCVT